MSAWRRNGPIILLAIGVLAIAAVTPAFWSLAQANDRIKVLEEELRKLVKKITVTQGTVVTVYHKCHDITIHPETGATSFTGRKGGCDVSEGTYVFGGGGSTQIEIVDEDECE